MKPPTGTLRSMTYLLFVLLISGSLAACGGGGGTTSSVPTAPTAGPATVGISIAAADVTGSAAPAVTVSGAGTVPSTDPGYLWPEQADPNIAHVYMEVVKVSLMPSEEAFGSGDMDGDIQAGSSPGPASPPDKPNFLTVEPEPPVWIDLLQLKNGKKLARLLNKFDQVPAGTYDKIRVYYGKVKVVLWDDTTPVYFHPTANSKFDIHFRQGHELVIPPVTTDMTQKDGWVKFFQVKLNVVGLKLKIVGQGKSLKGSKVILRPQIFAEFNTPILYSVAGTAKDVTANPDLTLPVSGTFNVKFGTGPTVIPVAYNGGTTWAYSDNILGHSSWIVTNIETTIDPTAMPVFRTDAKVIAIGPFDTSLVLQSTEIVFSFPYVKEGVVDNGWKSDNTFVLRYAAPDNVVYPKPDRWTAYYDNAVDTVTPYGPLSHLAIVDNVIVKARGYAVSGGIDAYWISIGDIVVGP